RWRRGWDCSRPGSAARPPLRSGPPRLRRDVQKSLRDFCRTRWVRPHILHRPIKKACKTGAFYVAERVRLLAAGVGRSSSASLRTAAAAPRRPKIAPRFLSNSVGSSTHPAPPNKKGLQDRRFLCGGEGEIARGRGRPLVLRFAPDRRGCAATSKNRSAIFVEPGGFVHTPCSVKIKSPRTGLFIY